MNTNTTPATPNQREAIGQALLDRILPQDLTETDARLLLEKIEEIAAALRPVILKAIRPESKSTATKTLTYPAEEEVFELTLDGDDPANAPLAMVKNDGYDPEGWKHKGPTVEGTQTRKFKLVRVGDCRDLEEVRKKLKKHGDVPEGQWRQAFKAAYPTPDGNGPIGVADASWTHPFGDRDFPCVSSLGSSYFYWTDSGCGGGWRWLVSIK